MFKPGQLTKLHYSARPINMSANLQPGEQKSNCEIASYLAGSHCIKHDFLSLVAVGNGSLISPVSVSLPALQTVLYSHAAH